MDNRPETSTKCLRTLAIEADATSGQRCCLSLLFADLARGELAVEYQFLTDERCYLVFVRREDPSGHGLSPHVRAILERALLSSDRQKVFASEAGRSISSISTALKKALHCMGLPCGASRTPLILTLAAQCYAANDVDSIARLASFPDSGGVHWVISVTRPDTVLAEVLPASEYEVARLLIEAKTHQEIALARGTSARTVANQLSSVFQRLKISGRHELVRYVTDRRSATAGPS